MLPTRGRVKTIVLAARFLFAPEFLRSVEAEGGHKGRPYGCMPLSSTSSP
jgi:hypothetical protein